MKKIVGLVEEVKIIGKNTIKIQAKFDTGARRTSIDYNIAKKAKLGPIVKTVKTISSLKKSGLKRAVVKVKLNISGKIISTYASISDRSHSKQKILIGRDILFNNFIVDVERSHKSPEVKDLK